MPFQTTHLFKYLELFADTAAPALVEFYTDQPGDALAVRHSESFDTEDTTTGARTVRIRLPGDARGKLVRVVISPTGVMRLYGARVYAKPLSSTQRTGWQWHALPVPPTPQTFADFALAVPPTPDGFADFDLGIPPTPDQYSDFALAIPPTPDGFSLAELPIPKTPTEAEWVQLPLDS